MHVNCLPNLRQFSFGLGSSLAFECVDWFIVILCNCFVSVLFSPLNSEFSSYLRGELQCVGFTQHMFRYKHFFWSATSISGRSHAVHCVHPYSWFFFTRWRHCKQTLSCGSNRTHSKKNNKTQRLFISKNSTDIVNDSVNLLGLTMDNDFIWDKDIDSLCGKLSSIISLLRRLKFICFAHTYKKAKSFQKYKIRASDVENIILCISM